MPRNHFRRWLSVILAAILSSVAAASAFAADAPKTNPLPEPRFDPPPRLAITADELAKRKASPEYPALAKAAVAQADALLKNGIIVPDGEGDWTFYYACPKDGCDLQPKNLNEHVCPICKKVYTEKQIVNAYRTRLHDRANIAARDLGWAYLYTGDDKYAREVQRILLKLADDYKTYPARRDRWGRTGFMAQLGGRRYAQSLDEACGVIDLCKAYDLTRTSSVWTDEQRNHVEKDLFRAVADTLLFANRGINNHQTWYNAGLMCIGSVLGDKDLVKKIITMRGGLQFQMENSMGPNGFWYEGSIAYHNYALQAMIQIIDAGRRMHIPIHEEPRIKAMILAPLRYAYPNGQFPAINDSDAGHIGSFNNSFEWAWDLYHDPRFAHAIAQGNEARLKQLLGPDAKAGPAIDTTSADLPDAALVALRRGTGANATCVMVDYGEHGGGHGHFDKMNIVVFANGREWLLDPGRLTYSHKEYKTWVKETAAHNTVSIGGQTQAGVTGKMLWFQPRDQYAACATQTDKAYSGCVLTRYLLLADNMLVDAFDVTSDKPTQIDWFAHAISEKLQPVQNLGPGTTATLGDKHGYQHLTDGRSWTSPGPTQWDFIAPDKAKLRMWIAGDSPEVLFSCKGIGHYINTLVPCLVRRVQGNHARFYAVYDLSGRGDFVTSVETPAGKPLQVNVGTTAGAWKITFTDKGVECTPPAGK